MKTATALNSRQQPLRVLVVGLGRTGLSCARYLAKQGMQVAVTDSREQPQGLDALRESLPDVGLFLGGFADQAFGNAELLVVSPGVPLSTPQIQAAMVRGVPAIGDVELFARAVNRPVAAITGSNGKSTVTTLLGLMGRAAGIRTSLGGNLGEPVLELLEEDVELDVVELSSFQLETTDSLAPAVATVLNLSADHMDRYAGFEEYMEVKGRIYRNAEVGVYNRDDPRVMALPRSREALFFTLAAPAAENEFGVQEEKGRAWLSRGSELLLPADEVLMPGLHNRANALAALAMGSALELPLEAMTQVLTTFPGLPHRTEFVARGKGLSWYNDSKGTNPGATIAALAGLEQGDGSRTVLIAGGQGKSADFSELAGAVERYARAVVLIGEDRELIAEALAGTVEPRFAGTLQEAVELAAELAEPGDRVLLSPACASFDMFRGFEHRGEVFKACVQELLQ
ncbi:MAG: UDP-N-acetylmuramoyl-L-alanine--D-glutamate ligase [Gammaproteobacteria bacterium]|nr:MAG: UDP-N-acetylmuramoyl-L-alanine--D-glutamate ligase [Gammaproteobacteria bacterium]